MDELDRDLQLEASIAGVQPVAAPSQPTLEPAWPAATEPLELTAGQLARLRKRRANDPLERMLGESPMEVLSVDAASGTAVLEFALPGMAGRLAGFPLSGLEPAALQEKAPPDQRVEDWILANKAEFKRRYGPEWRRVMYGHAWKMYGHEQASRALPKHEHALTIAGRNWVTLREEPGGGGGAPELSVTVSGPVGAGKSRLLGTIARHLSDCGYHSTYEERDEQSDAESDADRGAWETDARGVLLRVRYEGPAQINEAAEVRKRSLTRTEANQLRIPKHELQCSVSHVQGKGYFAHTHRARSKFYPKPGAIPASALRFVSSTS
jgi:hypothetical protein